MKKKLAVATTAVLAMTMCLSMTACKDGASASALLPKYAGKYSTTVTTVTNFSADAYYEQDEYSYADSNGVVVLKKMAKTPSTDPNAINTYYSLYNIVKNTFVLQDQAERIYQLNDTLYYAVNLVENTYTLYDSASGVYASGVKGSPDNGVFTRKDGARIYVAPNGKVKEETNPFAKIVPADVPADVPAVEKVGDYYLDGPIQTGIFDVFNEKGEWKDSVNLKIELNISADAATQQYWTIGNKIFFQTLRTLPAMEEEYDYSLGDTKYDLDTYSYDLKKGSGKELKNFDYLVEDMFPDKPQEAVLSYNDSTIIATVQKIDDGTLSQRYVQSFNASGKVAVDLQKLVPGATSCSKVADDKIALSDASGYAYIYKGSKRVATIPSRYQVAGNYVYNYNESNKTLDIYDFKGKSILNAENVTDYSRTYNDNLIYSVQPEPTDATQVTYASLYVFDVKKGTSTLIGTNSDTVEYEDMGLGYTVTTKSGETETCATHFYDNSTVINGELDEPVTFFNDSEKGKTYLMFAVEANGTTTFYSIVVTSPYEK